MSDDSKISVGDLMEKNIGDKVYKEELDNKEPQCMTDMPVPDSVKVPLTSTEYKYAKSDLIHSTAHYKRSRKQREDPPINGQTYCIHSFTPSSGATPDKDGCFGVMKCRGTTAGKRDADERCEYLIRNVDSVSENLISHVGRDFPVTASGKYVEETREIDVNRKIEEVTEEHVQKQKDKEQKEIDDIKGRQQKLLDESKHDGKMDKKDLEYYVTLKVKLANQRLAKDDTEKRMKEVSIAIGKSEEEVKEIDEKFPEYKEQYMERYFEGLNNSGIEPDKNPLMKYMGEGVDMSKFKRVKKEGLEMKEEKKEEARAMGGAALLESRAEEGKTELSQN